MATLLDKSIWQNQSQLGQKVPSPYIVPSNQNVNPYAPVAGQNFAQDYYTKKMNSGQFNQNQYLQNAQGVAQDVADKSAGNITTDQYGIVKDTQAVSPQDLASQFNNQDSTITNTGNLATQAVEARKQWADLKRQQDLLNSYNVNPAQFNVTVTNTPSSGGGDSSTGGRAVALALQAYKNGTPYVWGGNSLTKGVDCSGLVQQVYMQLGINLPRTTYEQAKAGKVINLNSLMPGDLVFYNTNSDPNGIGQYAHVAIYIGNGQVVDARSTRSGMKVGSIYGAGTPVLGVRPW